MPGNTWNTAEQQVFFNENLPVYHTAVTEGKRSIKRFWDTINGEFYHKFPMRKELVEGKKLGEHVLEANYDLNADEAATYRAAMKSRDKQIKTLFRYLHKKNFEKTSKPEHAVSSKKNITAAAKVFVTKQRRTHHRSEAFYRLNKDWLDPLIQQAMEDAKGAKEGSDESDGEENDKEHDDDDQDKTVLAHKAEAKRKGWNLKLRGEVIRREMANASEEDLKAVEESVALEREQLRRAADLRLSGKALAREPELRQEALERVNTFLINNAKMYWEHAGMATITIGVAPDPSNPDKLKSRVVAYGRDADGMVITDFDPTLAGRIVKQFRAFAKTNLFTPERFATAAAEHAEALAKLDRDDEDDEMEQEQQEDPAEEVLEYDDEKAGEDSSNSSVPLGSMASALGKNVKRQVGSSGPTTKPVIAAPRIISRATTTAQDHAQKSTPTPPSSTESLGQAQNTAETAASPPLSMDANFPGPMNLIEPVTGSTPKKLATTTPSTTHTPPVDAAKVLGSGGLVGALPGAETAASSPGEGLAKTVLDKPSTSARRRVTRGNVVISSDSDSDSDQDVEQGDWTFLDEPHDLVEQESNETPDDRQPRSPDDSPKIWDTLITNVPVVGKASKEAVPERSSSGNTQTVPVEATEDEAAKAKSKGKGKKGKGRKVSKGGRGGKGTKADTQQQKQSDSTEPIDVVTQPTETLPSNTPPVNSQVPPIDTSAQGAADASKTTTGKRKVAPPSTTTVSAKAPVVPVDTNSGDSTDAAKTTGKRKVADTITAAPPVEEGRSKRQRNAVKFGDGTVFDGVRRTTRATTTVAKKGRK